MTGDQANGVGERGEPRRDEGAHVPPAGLPRLTPYELAFSEAGFETRTFPDLLEEAERTGVDTLHPEQFFFLTRATDAVRDLVDPDAPAEVLAQFRVLFFHAFNFWRFGRRLYALDAPVARYLVEARPRLDGWRLALPHPSVYVQLPPNLFWASVATDAPPEPVDGFFACAGETNDPFGGPGTHLHALLVLGMRRERAGFSVIPFDTGAGPDYPVAWAEPGRDEGADFSTLLPGGELAGLYSVVTNAEALTLLARALWYLDTHPSDVSVLPPPERRAEDRPGAVPLSRLPFHRVRLGGG